MGKGQATILLIIVGLVALFLFLSPQILRPSAPVEPIRFKNDIITLENFEVSNLRPVKGSIVTVSFDVTNNGDKTVDKVEIDFGGTTNSGNIEIVECEGADQIKVGSCLFNRLDSLDTRKVVAKYTAPGGPSSPTIQAKVTYPHKGSREALIPIIDDKTVRTPRIKFSQSQPSFGPLVVDIIPPTKGWAISNQPFEMKFKLRFAGSAAVGTSIPSIDKLEIEKNKFSVDLSKELEPAKKGDKGEYLSCQFKAGVVNGVSFPLMNADGAIKVNKEYSCNLQAVVKEGDLFGYKIGTIEVGFDYIFEFQKSQTLVVRGSD